MASLLRHLHLLRQTFPMRHSVTNIPTYCVLRHSAPTNFEQRAFCSDKSEDEPEEDLDNMPSHLRERWKRRTFSYAGYNYENKEIKIPKIGKVEGQVQYDPVLVRDLFDKMDGDMPATDMPDPYQKGQKKCILCHFDIDVDYKNVRLLSQFVSPYTGRIYGRNITGLCIPMQRRVAQLIRRARMYGFMPYIYKKPEYLNDPKLYNEKAIFK